MKETVKDTEGGGQLVSPDDIEHGLEASLGAQLAASPSSPDSPSQDLDPSQPPRIPFGPYAGMPISEIAVVDPAHLLEWIREGVGEAEVRAEAARVLALRQPERGMLRRARPWLAGGLAGLLALALVQAGIETLAGNASPGRLNASGSAAGASRIGFGLGAESGPGSGPGSGSGFDSQPGMSNQADRLASGGILAREGARHALGEGPGPKGPNASSNQNSSPSQGESSAIDYDAPCGARVPGAIPADSAGDFLDSFQAVEFEVMRGKDTGKVTFLNSRDPYQGHFYVAIFPGDYEQFGGAPAQRFKNHCIVVQGLIETYRGSPQIVLRDAADLRVVERDVDGERDAEEDP